MDNRAWMYDRYGPLGLKEEFMNGADSFVEFATSQVRFMDGEKIKCPCQKCRNCRFNMPNDVLEHLYRHGFLPDYYQWTAHGEPATPFINPSTSDQSLKGKAKGIYGQLNSEQRMIFDAAGPKFVPPTRFSVHTDFVHPSVPENDFQEHDEAEPLQPPNENSEEIHPPATNEENRSSKRFLDALEAADEPLWSGIFANEVGGADDDRIDAEFAGWFKTHVLQDKKLREDKLLYGLAWGPKAEAVSWPAYFVNGSLFHTMQRGDGKTTMNSGVCVKSSSYDDVGSDFYGLLEEIIEVEYIGVSVKMKVVLFRCRWFDPRKGMQLIHPNYNFVEVNHKKLYPKYEPLIPGAKRGRSDWWVVCKTKPRNRIEELWSYTAPAYQSEEDAIPEQLLQSRTEDIPENLCDPAGVIDYVDENEIVVSDEIGNEDEELWNTDATSSEESGSEDTNESDASD